MTDCKFIRIHNGIPVEITTWDYMGTRVVDLFQFNNIGNIVFEEPGYVVRKLTVVDWNQAVALRKEEQNLDNEEMFLLDWSAPGTWFVILFT